MGTLAVIGAPLAIIATIFSAREAALGRAPSARRRRARSKVISAVNARRSCTTAQVPKHPVTRTRAMMLQGQKALVTARGLLHRSSVVFKGVRWLRRHRPVIVTTITLALVAVGVFLSLWSPVDAEARASMWALVHNDPETLYDSATPEEIVTSELSRERFCEIYKAVVWPRMRLAIPEGPIVVSRSGPDMTKAIPLQAMRTSNGRTVQIMLDNWHTSDGGKYAVLLNVLRAAWLLDRSAAMPPEVYVQGTWKTMAYGLVRDRKKLEELGLKGLYYGPEDGFLTFDQMEDRYKQRLGSSYGSGL